MMTMVVVMMVMPAKLYKTIPIKEQYYNTKSHKISDTSYHII